MIMLVLSMGFLTMMIFVEDCRNLIACYRIKNSVICIMIQYLLQIHKKFDTFVQILYLVGLLTNPSRKQPI